MGHEANADYTCPMHPEVHKPFPGSCPKCEMTLEPATVVVPTSRLAYTCPMASSDRPRPAWKLSYLRHDA
jgi:hypothetical protein